MLGLETRGGSGTTLALPQATRDRFSAWLPAPFWKAPRASTSISVSLAQLIGGSVGAGSQDSPIPAPQDHARLERKYGMSAPVYVCVRRKARDLASAPLMVSLEQKDGTLKDADKLDPLSALLRKPNPWMTGAQLVYFASMFLDLTGNFFLLILRDRKGMPRELYPVNPMAVTIFGTASAPVSSYELFHYGQVIPDLRAYTPNQPGDMLHFKLGSPIPQNGTYAAAFPSPWGFGPLEAGWDLVITEGDTVRWNRNLVKNDARPVGLLTSKQSVDNPTASEALARWRAIYGGPDNAGGIAVLGNDIQYTALSFSPKDMDYLPASQELWRRIIVLFDMNETVLGFVSGDVGRRDEQVKDYWHGTIISTSSTDICPVFEPLAREFGEGYVVGQDFSKVRALAPNWPGIASAVSMVLDRGMPMKVANDVFELDVPEYPGWDRGYVSAGVVPIDPETGEPQAAPGFPPAPGDVPSAGDAFPPADGTPVPEDLPEDVQKALKLVDETVRRAVREEIDA